MTKTTRKNLKKNRPNVLAMRKKAKTTVLLPSPRTSQKDGWFERHFKLLTPIAIAAAGLLISFTQYLDSVKKLKYERSTNTVEQFEIEIDILTSFILFFPPEDSDSFEWARTGLTHKDKIDRLNADYAASEKLLSIKDPPVRTQDLFPMNPNAYARAAPVSLSITQEIRFAHSRLLDLAETPEFSPILAMLREFQRCLNSGDCDGVSLCARLSPLLYTWRTYQGRIDRGIDEWRKNSPHPAQIGIVAQLQGLTELCSSGRA